MAKNGPIPKAAVFDLGNVVLRIDISRIPLRLAELTAGDPREIATTLMADPWCFRLEAGEVSPQDFHRHLQETIGPMSYADFFEAWNSLFQGLIDGIAPLLTAARKNLRLVALTNTNAPHAQRWQALYADTLKVFEQVFMSHEIGLRKPDPRCFQAVLDYLNLPPEEVVFVDDTPGHVEAAVSMGMRGIVAVSPSQIARDLRELGVLLT